MMSVAMTRTLRDAVRGDCRERAELARTPIDLIMTLAAVPCRGQETLIEDLFGPLGYAIEAKADDVDPEGAQQNITLKATKRLSEMLTHVYVLLPVLDNRKHYWIGDAELEKLMAQGKGWLEDHPHRDLIVQRYLGHRKSLTNEAMSTLETEQDPAGDPARAGRGPRRRPRRAGRGAPPAKRRRPPRARRAARASTSSGSTGSRTSCATAARSGSWTSDAARAACRGACSPSRGTGRSPAPTCRRGRSRLRAGGSGYGR